MSFTDPVDLSHLGFNAHLERVANTHVGRIRVDSAGDNIATFGAARQFVIDHVLLAGHVCPELSKFDAETVYEREQHPIDVAEGSSDAGSVAAPSVMKRPKRSGGVPVSPSADEIDSFGFVRIMLRTDLHASSFVRLQFFSDSRYAIHTR